jgi:hypothetical protein
VVVPGFAQKIRPAQKVGRLHKNSVSVASCVAGGLFLAVAYHTYDESDKPSAKEESAKDYPWQPITQLSHLEGCGEQKRSHN